MEGREGNSKQAMHMKEGDRGIVKERPLPRAV
jgi:hypothetical protein